MLGRCVATDFVHGQGDEIADGIGTKLGFCRELGSRRGGGKEVATGIAKVSESSSGGQCWHNTKRISIFILQLFATLTLMGILLLLAATAAAAATVPLHAIFYI